MHPTQLIRSLWRRIPDARLKDIIRMRASREAFQLRQHPIVSEAAALQIAAAGQEADGTRFVTLEGGPTFYEEATAVKAPTGPHAYLYQALPQGLRSELPPACMDVVANIICRYLYPHADPTYTPPYRHAARGTLHLQQRDTVSDIPGITRLEAEEMTARFAVQPGDVVLDVGAYIGFGALRLAELVGPEGQVISCEADPRNQHLYRRNIQANQITNARLIPKAIWESRGRRRLLRNTEQLNGLVDGIVPGGKTEWVEVDSLDNVVADLCLDRVSHVSLTINGAEIEAVAGMDRILRDLQPNLSIAAWYKRGGQPIHKQLTQMLAAYRYETVVGRYGRIYAWPAPRASRTPLAA